MTRDFFSLSFLMILKANSGVIPGNIEQQVSHNIIHGIKGLLCSTDSALPRDDGAVSLDCRPGLSTVRHVFYFVHNVNQGLEAHQGGRAGRVFGKHPVYQERGQTFATPTNLVFDRQDTVSVIRELPHGQDAVVRRRDDVVLGRRIDGGDDTTHLGELFLQQTQHFGSQARPRTSKLEEQNISLMIVGI